MAWSRMSSACCCRNGRSRRARRSMATEAFWTRARPRSLGNFVWLARMAPANSAAVDECTEPNVERTRTGAGRTGRQRRCANGTSGSGYASSGGDGGGGGSGRGGGGGGADIGRRGGGVSSQITRTPGEAGGGVSGTIFGGTGDRGGDRPSASASMARTSSVSSHHRRGRDRRAGAPGHVAAKAACSGRTRPRAGTGECRRGSADTSSRSCIFSAASTQSISSSDIRAYFSIFCAE